MVNNTQLKIIIMMIDGEQHPGATLGLGSASVGLDLQVLIINTIPIIKIITIITIIIIPIIKIIIIIILRDCVRFTLSSSVSCVHLWPRLCSG